MLNLLQYRKNLSLIKTLSQAQGDEIKMVVMLKLIQHLENFSLTKTLSQDEGD